MNKFSLGKGKIYLLVMTLLVCFFATGCGKKESPDASVKTICVAILRQDQTALSRIKADGATIRSAMLAEFVKNFQASSGNIFTMDQAKRIGESFLQAYGRVDVATRVVSEEGDKATVEVTLGVLDVGAIDENSIFAEIAQSVTEYSSESEILEKCTQIMCREIGNLTPVRKNSFNVECAYNKEAGMWIPNDMQAFGTKMDLTIMGF